MFTSTLFYYIIGALVLAGWVLVVNAAPTVNATTDRYDASILSTTGNLVVVDSQTNTLYVYGLLDNNWVM